MSATVSEVLREQHQVLRAALARCLVGETGLDVEAFDRFRHHLLWHVSVEERVVVPALQQVLGRLPEGTAGLRKDHAGIAALCVPRPEREWVENLRDLLEEHYRVEESPGGLLSRCDELLVSSLNERVVADIAAQPPLKLAPFRRGPSVRAQVAELLRLTGVR